MRDISIEFLRLILAKGGCLVVKLSNKLMFFEDYTYNYESKKILISDNDNEFCVEGNIEFISQSDNSLKFNCDGETVEFALL